MIPTNDWNRFNHNFLACTKPALWLDISRMSFDASFFDTMQPLVANAYEDMKKLEAGEIANPDEGRQVGHYWLRNADIAPAGAALHPHPDLTIVAPVLPAAASSNDRSLWVRIETPRGAAVLPGGLLVSAHA